jgi:uncharacterized protein (DUF58 family)
MLEKIKKRFLRRITGKKTVYILPTKAGALFLVAITTLAVIGLTYGNNIVLMAAFLLLAFLLLIMHQAHFNLTGIRVVDFDIKSDHLNTGLPLTINLFNSSLFDINELKVKSEEQDLTYLSFCKAKESTGLKEKVYFKRRGSKNLRLITFTSTYPYNLFRTWTYRKVKVSFFVYPRLLVNKNLNQLYKLKLRDQFKTDVEGDFKELKKSDESMPSSKIDWKKYAKRRQLFYRIHEEPEENEYSLNLNKVQADNLEEKLDLLATWSRHLFQTKQKWELKLPKNRIPIRCNKEHLTESLELLSLE